MGFRRSGAMGAPTPYGTTCCPYRNLCSISSFSWIRRPLLSVERVGPPLFQSSIPASSSQPSSIFLAASQPANQASQPVSQPASQPASQLASQPASQPAASINELMIAGSWIRAKVFYRGSRLDLRLKASMTPDLRKPLKIDEIHENLRKA